MNKKILLIITLIMIFSFTISFAEDLNIDMNFSIGEDGLVKLTDKEDFDNSKAWGVMVDKYKVTIVGVAGIASVTMVLVFIKHFLSLGVNASNSSGRSEALKGIMVAGIATALLGVVTLVTYWFYISLKS